MILTTFLRAELFLQSTNSGNDCPPTRLHELQGGKVPNEKLTCNMSKLEATILHGGMIPVSTVLFPRCSYIFFNSLNVSAALLLNSSSWLQYEAAAQILVEIGSVEFLSQLRLHSDPSLHPLIDKIIEQLLKLPQNAADSAGPEKEHCSSTSSSSSAISQQTSTTESSTDYGSYLKVSKQSFGLTDESTALPPEYLERASSVGTSTQSSVPGSTSSSNMEASERLRFGVVGERPQACFPYVVSPAGMTSAAQEDRSERNPRTEPNGKLAYKVKAKWVRLTVGSSIMPRGIFSMAEAFSK